jgi:hypothetical protein
MRGRRGTLVEDGARELLMVHSFSVWVVPHSYNKHFPPAHLVAERPPGEKRLIRIRKLAHRAASVEMVELKCRLDIEQFRKYLSRHKGETGSRCEIWIYTLQYGFRCFEVLMDSIREIPKLTLFFPVVRNAGGVA